MPLIKRPERPAGITVLLAIHLLGAAVFVFMALVMFVLMREATSGTTFNTDIAEGLKPFIAGAGLMNLVPAELGEGEEIGGENVEVETLGDLFEVPKHA